MRVIDFCSGPGGLGTGFSKYFEVQLAVDKDKDAVKTYDFNHRETEVLRKKVERVTFSKKDFDGLIGFFNLESYKDEDDEEINRPILPFDREESEQNFGMVAGYPCQEYSPLNLHKKKNSKRALLINDSLRSIDELKPEFILLENVPKLEREIKERIAKEIKRRGYKVVSKIYNSYDYGSIQKRRRWILTASKTRHISPQPFANTRKVSDILTKEVSELNVEPETLAAIKKLEVTGKWVPLPRQTFDNYFILEEDGHFPAVANPCKLRYIKPDRSGYLTLNEMKLAQGFPVDYKFFGTTTSIGQQLANAVPVELASRFAEAFYHILVKKHSLHDFF